MNQTTVTVNDKEYELDVSQAINLGVLKPKKLYKAGQKFRYDGSAYLLCFCGRNEMILMNINSGIRFSDPINVPHDLDYQKIPTDLFNKLTCNEWDFLWPEFNS